VRGPCQDHHFTICNIKSLQVLYTYNSISLRYWDEGVVNKTRKGCLFVWEEMLGLLLRWMFWIIKAAWLTFYVEMTRWCGHFTGVMVVCVWDIRASATAFIYQANNATVLLTYFYDEVVVKKTRNGGYSVCFFVRIHASTAAFLIITQTTQQYYLHTFMLRWGGGQENMQWWVFSVFFVRSNASFCEEPCQDI
jgi:hypothetical protein